MQTVVPFLISLAVFILIISGILGIAVNLFFEDGLIVQLLGKIWDMGTHFLVTAIPILTGAIILGKYWIVPGLDKGGSSASANILMFLMMAAGGYFIFLYLTTGSLIYQPPI